ncbi:hypothetical protein [Jidongwangia harbinensis]|uniref:hypothetical protein n=1 Tax=Jidongwangia harbinensis TaxID=2878561 RepID=UPI001CDA223C|nr:hypothetical protein [Jidongwangia harbinensis]MCA2218981.1 hypothetical protein [Jidongwangia harbinensis]
MSRDTQGPAGPVGPVLIGVLGAAPAEEALRYAFDEAGRRAAALLVLLAGDEPGDGGVGHDDMVQRWSEKYPDVHVTITVRRRLDPAVVLAALSRDCGLLVVAQPADPAGTALVGALSRRAHCPMVVCGSGVA